MTLEPAGSKQAKWEADPVLDDFPGFPQPFFSLAPGVPLPPLLQPSGNPHSAGLYPLGRKYTIGDEAVFRVLDLYSGVESRTYRLGVSDVTLYPDRVYLNSGGVIWDSMGNVLKVGPLEFDVPKQLVPAELQVGRKWTAVSRVRRGGISGGRSEVDYRISGRERVTVPAGTFNAFKIEGRGWSEGLRLEETIWVMPWVNFPIRLDRLAGQNGWYPVADQTELVSLTQYAIDDPPPTNGG